jgi:hypothetical protein
MVGLGVAEGGKRVCVGVLMTTRSGVCVAAGVEEAKLAELFPALHADRTAASKKKSAHFLEKNALLWITGLYNIPF